MKLFHACNHDHNRLSSYRRFPDFHPEFEERRAAPEYISDNRHDINGYILTSAALPDPIFPVHLHFIRMETRHFSSGHNLPLACPQSHEDYLICSFATS